MLRMCTAAMRMNVWRALSMAPATRGPVVAARGVKVNRTWDVIQSCHEISWKFSQCKFKR